MAKKSASKTRTSAARSSVQDVVSPFRFGELPSEDRQVLVVHRGGVSVDYPHSFYNVGFNGAYPWCFVSDLVAFAERANEKVSH